MKSNNLKSVSRIDDFKPCHITFNVMLLFDMRVYLPWGLLHILLNIFLEYGGFDNIVVIPAYTSTNFMLYCEKVLIQRYKEKEKNEDPDNGKISD